GLCRWRRCRGRWRQRWWRRRRRRRRWQEMETNARRVTPAVIPNVERLGREPAMRAVVRIVDVGHLTEDGELLRDVVARRCVDLQLLVDENSLRPEIPA